MAKIWLSASGGSQTAGKIEGSPLGLRPTNGLPGLCRQKSCRFVVTRPKKIRKDQTPAVPNPNLVNELHDVSNRLCSGERLQIFGTTWWLPERLPTNSDDGERSGKSSPWVDYARSSNSHISLTSFGFVMESEMSEIVLGIDLGTAMSLAACVDEADLVHVIPSREGNLMTPSVVLFEDGRTVVGQEALNQAVVKSGQVAQWIKRKMGEPEYRFQGKYTAAEVSAEVLRKIVVDAQDYLQQPIRRAVITVPAYFTKTPREQTMEAGRLAGLVVEDLLNEPEAAAVHFGVDRLDDGESVLVCDLGGGTYDATVLQMNGGTLEAACTRGYRELGGFNWTNNMMTILATRITTQIDNDPLEDPELWQRLYEVSELVKCQLSATPQTRAQWSDRGKTLEMEVTREEFEKCCEPLLSQVIEKTVEAIDQSGEAGQKIKHVLLVGGSSRLPSFASAVERVTGKSPRRARRPDEAVVRGAALVARSYGEGKADKTTGRIMLPASATGGGGKLVLQRRTSHALGTLIYRRTPQGVEYIPDTIIPENSNVPIVVEKAGYLAAARQTTFQAPILQIDSLGQEQEQLGNYRFHGVPLRQEGSEIMIRFEYDVHSIPHVSAFDVQTGNELDREICDFELEPPPKGQDECPATVVLAVDCSGSMSGSKIVEAKRVMGELAEKYTELGRNWSIGVVNFGGNYEIYPSTVLLEPTQSLDEIRAVANQLSIGGGTPMAAGLENVREILENVGGIRIAIVITDGQPADRIQTAQTAETLKNLQIKIGTVPIGSDANRTFLSSIGDLASDISVDGSGHGMAAAVIDLLQRI